MHGRWRKIALTLTATVVLAGSASAQFGPPRGGPPTGGPRGGGPPGGPMGRGPMGGAMMLRIPGVQRELKLTATQKTTVEAMLQELFEQRRGQFFEMRDLSPEERQKRMAAWRAQDQKQVNTILTPTQQKRFRQLQLQQQGPSALGDQPVQEMLKLTATQRTKVQAIHRQQGESMRAAFPRDGGPPDFQAMRTKMEALRKQTDAKLLAILTEPQKKAWKALLGPPFKFPEFRFGPPGGPGGPPPGGPPPGA